MTKQNDRMTEVENLEAQEPQELTEVQAEAVTGGKRVEDLPELAGGSKPTGAIGG
jgi:hypothetical protein